MLKCLYSPFVEKSQNNLCGIAGRAPKKNHKKKTLFLHAKKTPYVRKIRVWKGTGCGYSIARTHLCKWKKKKLGGWKWKNSPLSRRLLIRIGPRSIYSQRFAAGKDRCTSRLYWVVAKEECMWKVETFGECLRNAICIQNFGIHTLVVFSTFRKKKETLGAICRLFGVTNLKNINGFWMYEFLVWEEQLLQSIFFRRTRETSGKAKRD